jgi:S1-C subfamily serine protease
VIGRPSADAGFDGTVGFGFLSNFNIVIDFDRRRIWLENFTGKVGNDEPGDVGLGFFPERHDQRITVYSVAPDSPADKAGIKKGDQLLAIDGKDLPPVVGLFELRRRLEGPKGSKVKLDLSRNGQLMRYELERACLAND